MSFGNARAASRDAKRQTDIQGLSLGLRLYLARSASLPDQTVASNWTSFISLLGAAGTVPPVPEEDYCYYRNAVGDTYAVVATDLEKEIPGGAVTDISGLSLIVESSGDGNCYGSNGVGPQCGAPGLTPSAGDDFCAKFPIIKLFE